MNILEGISVKVKAKVIEIEGPRRKLIRNFKHLNFDFQIADSGRKLKVDAWFGSRKTMAAIRTAISDVQNLITGVTKGYRYNMRFVYAHFPINASITNENTSIKIRNFLGEKNVPSLRFCQCEKDECQSVQKGNGLQSSRPVGTYSLMPGLREMSRVPSRFLLRKVRSSLAISVDVEFLLGVNDGLVTCLPDCKDGAWFVF